MRLTKKVARLIDRERVCRVATTNAAGMPHLVPVCDDGRKALNLAANPRVAVTVDLYSDDWSNIKGVMVQGRATLHARGPRFRKIRALLYRKYPQYARDAAISESDSVVVEVTPGRVFTWGV